MTGPRQHDPLVIDDFPAEGLPLLRVGESVVQRTLGQSYGHRAARRRGLLP